jgi:exopolysaccharide biosynthesis WecB/TagA/CpsF family protein
MKKIILQKIPKEFENFAKKTSFINPFSYSLLRNNKEIYEKIDVFYVDGISLVWLLKLFGVKTYRLSFDMTSVAPKVFNSCISEKSTIYFIGAKQIEIEKSIKKIKEYYPNLNVIGFRNGYFSDEEKEQVYAEIIQANPGYLIAGLGTPLQEKFIVEISERGYNGKCYTCGGFIHQSADDLNYYPVFFNTLNIRWIYRIYKEPKLLKRYFIDYPKAFLYLIFDFLSFSEKKILPINKNT